MNGLITAIRTLTIMRIPGRDADDLASSLPWFPVVGAVIGCLVALLSWAMGVWPLGAGIMCVALSTIITGGLHLDGLADAFDSFGGRTRERKLEIMKDPRIGSFGVTAIAICLLIKFVAIARLSGFNHHTWIALPFVASRTMQVAVAVWLPYARAEDGTGKRFIEGATRFHFLMALLLAVVLCGIVSPVVGISALGCGLLIAVVLTPWMRKTYGGVTGDLLGMTSEMVETVLLLALAAWSGTLTGW